MKSDKSIERTSKLIKNIAEKITNERLMVGEGKSDEIRDVLVDFGLAVHQIICDELYSASLFEYEDKGISYPRQKQDQEKLREYKEKVNQLLTVDKKMSMVNIAKELNMSRQGIYKNKELMRFIEEMKK